MARGRRHACGDAWERLRVMPIAAIDQVVELNIGHFLIGEAIFSGLDSAMQRMRSLMNQARANKGAA